MQPFLSANAGMSKGASGFLELKIKNSFLRSVLMKNLNESSFLFFKLKSSLSEEDWFMLLLS